MRVLITGGAGFIGTNLATSLIERGNDVTIFDNLSRRSVDQNVRFLQRQFENRVEIVRADIADRAKLEKAVSVVDVVFHLAAQVAVTTSVDDPRTDFTVNAGGTFNVLEAARAAPKPPIVLFTSTNKVYGRLDAVHVEETADGYRFTDRTGIDEDCALDFHSPYGCSKGAADQYMLDYARIYGLRTVVFRMSCIYGPHQMGCEDQGWVAHFLISGCDGVPLVVYGNGKQVRDILFVEDLVRAFDLAVKHIDAVSGEAFNIGGGPDSAISLLQLLEFMAHKLGWRPAVSFSEFRPGDQLIYVSDSHKARERLGWVPQIDKWNGLRRLASWILETRNYTKILPRAEASGAIGGSGEVRS